MKKLIALCLIGMFICGVAFAEREQDLMSQLGQKRLQIQNLEDQSLRARQEEQQLIGAILETQRLKKELENKRLLEEANKATEKKDD